MGRTFTENETKYLEKIGKELKTYRNNKKLTQKGVAEKIHIKVQDISEYERGKKEIGLLALKKLCKHYGITLNTFFYRIEKPKDNIIINEIDELKTMVTSFSVKATSIARLLEDKNNADN